MISHLSLRVRLVFSPRPYNCCSCPILLSLGSGVLNTRHCAVGHIRGPNLALCNLITPAALSSNFGSLRSPFEARKAQREVQGVWGRAEIAVVISMGVLAL